VLFITAVFGYYLSCIIKIVKIENNIRKMMEKWKRGTNIFFFSGGGNKRFQKEIEPGQFFFFSVRPLCLFKT
jgi:hypothetical protein